MKFSLKKFWKDSTVAFIIKNLLLAAVILVAIVYIVLFAVDGYTHHGEAEVVPDLRSMYTPEAEILLAAQGLNLQVIDSMYDRQKPLGTIVEQTPPPSSTIKKGRAVYAIINATAVRQVAVPDVRDVSLRQAQAVLAALELKVDRIDYEPSEYKDLVLDMLLDGRSVETGTRVPEGTAITLVVGQGSGTDVVCVPDLLGLPLSVVRDKVREATFVIGAVEYDVPPTDNEADYVVVLQHPEAGSWHVAGSRIDLLLSTDKEKIARPKQNTSAEDDFF